MQKGSFSMKSGGLFTLKGGMTRLIETLANKVEAQILLSSPITSLQDVDADQIVSALPGDVLGRLTGKWTDFKSLSLWVINLGFDRLVLPKRGFGYLVPTQEKENLMGMIWDSQVFPEQNGPGKTCVTLIMRDGSLNAALDAMQRHLNVKDAPSMSHIANLENAIPQFEVGYSERLARLRAELPKRVHLLGNYLEGASVDACIALAKRPLLHV
jgi:oxygen-dependent protoporphyrinogen oxidase